MAERGRRPGKRETAAEIVAAARAVFGEDGYERASLRGIAARAGVDPALVHHYFPGGKAELFSVSFYIGRDPRTSVDEVIDEVGRPRPGELPAPGKGAVLIRSFLALWDGGIEAGMEHPGAADGSGGSSYVSMVQAVSASPEAADALREFLVDRVWSHIGDDAADDQTARRALVASQLNGLAFTRYVLRLEPLASATPDQIAAWIGPTLDRYASGSLES